MGVLNRWICEITDTVGIPQIDNYSSSNVCRIILTHKVGCLHKYNCLHKEEALTMVSSASSCHQLGLPAQTVSQEAGKNLKWTGNQKRLKVEKATNSSFNGLPQKQLHLHGISLKYMRKLGEKEQRKKKQKKLAILVNEKIEVFNYPRKGSRAYHLNGSFLLYFNSCRILTKVVHQLINENLFLHFAVHIVD